MNDYQNKRSIVSVFNEAVNIAVYKNGNKSLFFKGDDKFELIFYALMNTTNNAHDMPALGVSLNAETIESKKQGIWIELVFNTEQTFNEMPFECLLFEVKSDNSGFNLIRKTNGKYEGRCFYLSLENDMQNLTDAVNKILE